MVFDIVVVVVVLVSALIAFLRGFIREILTITGVVGGMAAAYAFGPLLIPYMDQWLGVKEGVEPEKLLGILPYNILADILSYGVIFIAVAITLSIVSHIMAETARAIGLGPVDRTLGVVFGIARGVVLVALVYLPFHVLLGDEQKKEFFEGSKTFYFIEETATAMANLLPEDTIKKMNEGVVKAADTAKDAAADAAVSGHGLDVLKQNGMQPAQPTEPQAPADNAPGYTKDFRNEMDKLFENKPAETATPPQPQPVQKPAE